MSNINKKLPIYQELSRIQKEIIQAKERVKALKLQPKYTAKDAAIYYESFMNNILKISGKAFNNLEKLYKMDFSLHYDQLTSQRNGDLKAINNAIKTTTREEVFDLTVKRLGVLHNSFDTIGSAIDKSIDLKDKPKLFGKGK